MIDTAPGECWPIDGARPAGSIELGTGENAFVPMTDEVEVIYSPSASFYLPVHSRMAGLQPGNPANLLDPNNPRTRFSAYFVDTGLRTNSSGCAVRYGYTQSAGPAFDLASGTVIFYDVDTVPADIFDREMRVVVEIIDSAGSYATAEKLVIARKPANYP